MGIYSDYQIAFIKEISCISIQSEKFRMLLGHIDYYTLYLTRASFFALAKPGACTLDSIHF